jgi:epoxyqueuosine reductase QueG
MDKRSLTEYIQSAIRREVDQAGTITQYRDPLVRFVSANDPKFADLKEKVHPNHKLPQDLLPYARSVVSIFFPFEKFIVIANAQEEESIAKEWVEAYIETNALIERITGQLIEGLLARGVRAAAEPPTGNFDRDSLVSSWSHKSVAVIAGLGSFGLHHLVITDSGCAGRFGSLILDTDLPIHESQLKERCLYFVDGSCWECVLRCPAGALDQTRGLDKQLCWEKCQKTAGEYRQLGSATVCGKCAVGICAVRSPI